MPDAMDLVQQHNDDSVADASKRHASLAVPVGRTMCANVDCGEPISEHRRRDGAQLCLGCQRTEEAQAVHFRQWGRR